MKPILFNTEMVRAVLESRKTVTRRVVKPPALYAIQEDSNGQCVGSYYEDDYTAYIYPTVDDCPYQPGDILYVRETWNTNPLHDFGSEPNVYVYKADYDGHAGEFGWRPSIHMPREAARLFLRVTDVKAERLQDITIEDIHAEGWPEYLMPTDDELRKMVEEFVKLWDSTVKPADLALYGWSSNPWVWVIEFERVSKEEVEHGLQRAD